MNFRFLLLLELDTLTAKYVQARVPFYLDSLVAKLYFFGSMGVDRKGKQILTKEHANPPSCPS